MKNCLVSVIIVSWNRKMWLKKCLDSLRCQTFKNFEIILVDNSSTDGSVFYVRKNYPEVCIYQSENNGFGRACNHGAQKSLGKFLIFFNEDMYVDNNFIEKYLDEYQKIKNKKNIGTIGCTIAEYNGLRTMNEKMFGYGIDLMGAPCPNFNKDKIFYNAGNTLFISRDTFLKAGGFCKNIFLYSEDIDLCWRLSLYGYKHYFFPNINIYHNSAKGSFSPQKLSWYIRGEINCLFNNYSAWLLPISLLYFLVFYIFLSLIYLSTRKLRFFKIIYVSIWDELKNNLANILAFRKIVQSSRVVSDRELIKMINIIPSRLINITKPNFLAIKLRKIIFPDCLTLLDIGCGENSVVQFLKPKLQKAIGIDLFLKSIKRSKYKNIHDKYIKGDVLEIDRFFKPKSFDCVLCIDVIEHLEKKEAFKLIEKMERVAKKCVAIQTTNGYLQQGSVGGNQYQVHKCGFTVQELKVLGYKVVGMGGPKFLRGEQAAIKYQPLLIFAIIANILEIFFHFIPKQSFGLLAYKKTNQ